ncbi:MAG: hypothetical protein JSV53_11640 [candidate division WOR-3 bacterium]|nr:MAG: hypothetical protein JSV53_11640 [candidate division WOR-3 bacterium]
MDLALLCAFLTGTISDTVPLKLDSAYYVYEVVDYDTSVGEIETTLSYDTLKQDMSTLRISGAKDFSFDAQQGFDQGLKVNITGEVEGVKIEGNLSDKATPSSTVRLSEIERISLRAFAKNFSGGIGNLTLNLPFGIKDEIRGARIGIHTEDKKRNINASYAVNRGAYARVQFSGEEGKQSPYFLEGAVIAGSERVFIAQGIAQPVLLSRDTDYYIDYESGIVSFTNNYVITSRTRIEVEYQKAIEDYLNTYQQTDGMFTIGGVEISGLYRASVDDKHNPLTFVLSPEETDSLALAGDSARVMHIYADTSSEGSYVIQNDRFVYVGQGNGEYDVTFFYVGEGNGDYIYDPVLSAFSYEGAGLGNYTPTKNLPLPRREEFYAFSTDIYDALTLRAYGSRLDQNTFSSIDDEDNDGFGYGARFDKTIGFVTIGGEYQRYDDDFFSPTSRENIDYAHVWNTNDPLEELADFSLGIAPKDYIKADIGYGLLNRKHKRRFINFRPFFFVFGYENIDGLKRYSAGATKKFSRLLLTSRYEKYGSVQIINYGAQYEIRKNINIGVSGGFDRDSISSGVTNTVNLSTLPFRVSLGHRSLNDTSFYFGNASINYASKGFSLFGDLQQTQRYSQKRDETYIKVDDGEGDYVYDSVTDTYIKKEGGDYIRRIFLLPDFTRVITRNFGIELGYAKDFYDVNGRFYYIDEEDFRNHSEDVALNFGAASYDVALHLRQSIQEDARYALGVNSTHERVAIIIPSFKTLSGRFEIQTTTDKTGEAENEHRTTYLTEISYDVIQQPILRPKAGYAYSSMRSQYFTQLDIRQHAAKSGILFSFPLKSLKGKIETNADFVYRIYNIDDIPFFFAANEPKGLTTALTGIASFGVGANTLFNLIYRVEFRPDEDPSQNLRLQSRIRF